MAAKEIEVLVRGTVNSGVTSLTSDLERKLKEAGAIVIVDPSCTEDGRESYGLPFHRFTALKDVVVTLKNQRLHVPSHSGEEAEHEVRFKDGEAFDISTDRLIRLSNVLDILQISRITLMRWIEAGKFPRAHFQFGPTSYRWVERLVLEWKAKNLEPSQHEKDEAEMHSKGVVTDEILDQ